MKKTLYGSVLVFLVLLISVSQGFGIVHLDDSMRLKVQELWSEDLNKIIIAITDFGAEFSVFLSLILTVLYFGFKRQGVMIRFFLTALFGGVLLFDGFKLMIGRERPSSMMVQEEALSFPSGHATIATVLGLFVYLAFSSGLSNRRKMIFLSVCLIYPMLMSFTRVYLNVHYLSDVVAGMALGTAWMIFLSKYYLNREA